MTPSTADLPAREETSLDVAASCATPVALMFFASLGWLVASGVFALIASVKLHSPVILANCAALGYGHVKPAANDAFVYGFASQAGTAVALWMLCRLGAVRLFGPIAVTIAAVTWNFGVALGVLGILAGDTTGFEWMEMPSYGSAFFFCSFLVMAVCALVTFVRRRTSGLYPSQWYILAAFLWLPWLYTTARLLLVWHPVRGAMQFLVNGWFASGLLTLWLGGLGVAVLYYFLPKMTTGQLLYSRSLAVFGFWTMAAFAPWAGLYRGAPLPAWILSVSIAGSVLTLVSLVATAINLWESRRDAALECNRIWFSTSFVFFVVAGVLTPMVALCPISAITVVAEAVQVLALYGFVGFGLFGAIYYIAPRLFLGEIACGTRGKWTWWCTMLGVLFFSGALIIGGLQQGHNLRSGAVPFPQVMNSLKPFLRLSTLGVLLLLLGNVTIFANIVQILGQCCCRCCCPDRVQKLKPLVP